MYIYIYIYTCVSVSLCVCSPSCLLICLLACLSLCASTYVIMRRFGVFWGPPSSWTSTQLSLMYVLCMYRNKTRTRQQIFARETPYALFRSSAYAVLIAESYVIHNCFRVPSSESRVLVPPGTELLIASRDPLLLSWPPLTFCTCVSPSGHFSSNVVIPRRSFFYL